MKFYLGTHIVSWLWKAWVPLFVSERRLRERRVLKRANCRWALDSGGFSELSMFGRWTISPKEYVLHVSRYSTLIGGLDWAAAQDWMCEPGIREKTGLSIREHQIRTVENYAELKNLAPSLPFAPVLQGWDISDYHEHVEMYDVRGIDIREAPVVGVGSVCRRQRTSEGIEIFTGLSAYGFRLHGFGVKTSTLRKVPDIFHSADSMAWSLAARFQRPLPGHRHKNCANCVQFAMIWRAKILRAIAEREARA